MICQYCKKVIDELSEACACQKCVHEMDVQLTKFEQGLYEDELREATDLLQKALVGRKVIRVEAGMRYVNGQYRGDMIVTCDNGAQIWFGQFHFHQIEGDPT